jgi:hypothetical protein
MSTSQLYFTQIKFTSVGSELENSGVIRVIISVFIVGNDMIFFSVGDFKDLFIGRRMKIDVMIL